MKAKWFWRIAVLIMANVLSSFAQLALNPGDVWTNSFDDLPFIGENKIFPGDQREGVLSFAIAPGSFENGSALRFEMFEGDPSGAPRAAGTVTSQPSQPIMLHSLFAWQDLAGSVRFTMLAGSCIVTTVQFTVRIPNSPSYFNVYSTNFTPDPSPPRLFVERASNTVQISWWTNGADGYVLESTNVLQSGAWPEHPQMPVVTNRRNVVVVSPAAQEYFRLRK